MAAPPIYLLQKRVEATQTTTSPPSEPHIPLLQSLPLLQGSPFASLVGPDVIGMPVGCGVGRFVGWLVRSPVGWLVGKLVG